MDLFCRAFLLIAISFIVPSSVLAFPVPDTGQTKCYNNTVEIPCPNPGETFYGQDGNYLINPPSYTKLDALGNDLPDTATSWATVRDNVTGLIWEVKQNNDGISDYANPNDADNAYTWYDSNPETNGGDSGATGDGRDTEDFIAALNTANYGGYSDWRLPTPRELRSIVKHSRTGPAIDTAFLPNTKTYAYWTSITSASDTSGAWLVYFDSGRLDWAYKYQGYHVRAVRSGQSETLDDLVINGDGTVTDRATGLMWEQKTDDDGLNDKDNRYSWEQALQWVATLNANNYMGYNDWRLPTVNELESIVDLTGYHPSIDTAFFPNTRWYHYWSSTTYAGDTGYAWIVYLNYGNVYSYGKSNSHYIRAVRSGQSRVLGHLVISEPGQGTKWEVGDSMPITWDTAGLGGNVAIAISRDGGKTYANIVAATTNDGSYDWIVSRASSANCMLRITPEIDPLKGTTQGLFTILAHLPGDVNNSGSLDIADALLAIQTTTGKETAQQIYKSADVSGNGQIGTDEAIFALQSVAGLRAVSSGYSAPDLEGTWFFGGSDIQGDHTWDGSIAVNSTGTITNGALISSSGPVYSVNSGSLSITDTGGISGAFLDSDGITTQFTMQMNKAKAIMAGEGNADGEDGVFVYVKTSTGNSTSDLAGEWFLGGSDIQGDHTWDGTITVNTSGTITGGTLRSSAGPVYSISSGSFSASASGGINGSFLDSDGITTQFTMQLDSTKAIMAGEGNASGEDGLFVFIKTGSGHSVADIAGDWFFGGSDIQGNHTWDGAITVDSTGNITGGNLNNSDGPAYSVSSGSLAVNASGGITGSFLDSDGITTQFTMQIDAAKGVMAGEGNASGEDGVFIFIKK